MNYEHLPLFHSLTPIQIEKLLVDSVEKTYGKDQIIFFEGEKAVSLLIVLEGDVTVYKCGSEGTETILHSFHRGDIFAEMPCFNSSVYPASAKALNKATILHVNCQNFKAALSEDAMIAMNMISSLSQKIITLNRYIDTKLHMSATEKVLHYLLNDSERFFYKKNKEIAAELNMRVETFSRVMRKLKDAGAIDIKAKRIDKSKLASMT